MFKSLLEVGRCICWNLTENNAFPRDDAAEVMIYQDGRTGKWHDQLNVEQMLNRRELSTQPKEILCNANIWTVIKNLPDNPPGNLVVLATRNIDPSSLRTKLTEEDMHKHIQFKEGKDDVLLLRGFAGVVRADGRAIRLGAYRQIPYGKIYGKKPFDLTTNLVDGRQVKYLTPEGMEVIPTND